jgi:hypothetical protein
MTSVLTKSQTKKFSKVVGNLKIEAIVRFDDSCNNGHNTFSITGQTWGKDRYGYWREETGGCIHNEISEHFPELSHLIRWHLCSTDGPMYYIANTVYLAGDRDYNGLKAGEFKPINDKDGMPLWNLNIPREVQTRYLPSSEKPAALTFEYERFGRVGEGKARELDKARSSAIWPDATDEELMSDDLKDRLAARLPTLLEDFRKDIEAIGFTW